MVSVFGEKIKIRSLTRIYFRYSDHVCAREEIFRLFFLFSKLVIEKISLESINKWEFCQADSIVYIFLLHIFICDLLVSYVSTTLSKTNTFEDTFDFALE